MFGWLAPQMSGAVQEPQFGVRPPQPSPTWPQFTPSCAQVFGAHVEPPSGAPRPHLLEPAPPQNSGDVQTPQLSVLPHPSPCVPQVAASDAHVAGTHAEPPSAPP